MKILAISPEPRAFQRIADGMDPGELVIESTLSGGLRRVGSGPWSLVLLDSAFHEDMTPALADRIAEKSRSVVILSRSDSAGRDRWRLEGGAAEVMPFPPDPKRVFAHLARAAAAAGVDSPGTDRCAMEGAMVGGSERWSQALHTASQVARSTATVVLEGESGTGKELLARYLHHSSGRRERPFVALNCAGLPEGLLESELFGHEKGAFTGATQRRIGRFERAHRGTLFLDEIGDTSAAMQAKLLRVLQEQEFERVGGTATVAVDVRVVAATNKDLRREVAEGRFREDLYYRLAVVVIKLPPLRQRGGDIRLLARHCAECVAREHGIQQPQITEEALKVLELYSWPGNVRQLRNVMERAVLLVEGGEVRPEHLPADVRGVGPAPEHARGDELETEALLPLHEIERRHIRRAIERTGGHLARTADLLGIHRNTLRRKLAIYDLNTDLASA